MNRLLITLLTACVTWDTVAQPVIREGFVKNIVPVHTLSSDGQTIALYEKTEGGQRYAKILNLTDWSVASSTELGSFILTPDLKSGYWNWVSGEKYKGADGWEPFKKYCPYYFTDLVSGKGTKRGWPDRNLIIAVMPDGMLLTGDELTLRKNSSLMDLMRKITGLSITNPTTGETMRQVRSGVAFEQAPIWTWDKPASVIGAGTLLVWQSFGEVWASMPIGGGAPKVVRAPYAGLHGFGGKLGFSVGRKGAMADGYRANRKVVIDMETGNYIYDRLNTAKLTREWGTAGSDGHFYTLNEATMELTEEIWKDPGLSLISTRKLDTAGVKLSDVHTSQSYRMIVSKSAGKVLMIPLEWKRAGDKLNELYAWDLTTGRLLLKVVNYFRPSAEVLAKYDAPIPPPKAALQPNTMVVQNGGYYILLRQDATSKQWSAIELLKDRHGNYERRQVQRPDNFFTTYNTTTVSTTPCSVCSGSGTMTVNEMRTTQTEEKMIYNKLVTTRTGNVAVDEVCSQCRGAGFRH